MDAVDGDLTSKMLIAMPGMADDRFARSVVFLCDHSSARAMGFIVNKPMQGLGLRKMLKQLDIGFGAVAADTPVRYGGPVETGRGFVLHSRDYTSDMATLNVAGGFGMTATVDILEDIGRGNGPEKALMALGYAGWGPGQLEREIAANGWLVCEASHELVFETPDLEKWDAALETLGVSALMLSATGGQA